MIKERRRGLRPRGKGFGQVGRVSVRRALALRERLDALIAQAVVAEREEDATWTEVGAAAGITRQSAQRGGRHRSPPGAPPDAGP
ncbi:hypothetical protein [Streptomyces sp. 303MFCol5.2]|uniref:hypothetical protein n=1 Tax=Streptomyces sp. 303MFCol5.2 TaxID=1172181 RepID=UPI0003A2D232|nr:hypothetical protein [Streptomyces sp. 303MFCol5.2]